jgi:tetratricopeptide (TPR) repeat protein
LLWRYWGARGLYELGRRALEDALSRPGAEAPTDARAHALVRAGGLALYQGDYLAARPRIEASLALYRQLGDSRGVARALSGLAVVATYQGDYAVARACNEESLAGYRALGQRRGEAVALHNLGYLAWCEQDGVASERHFSDAMAILHEVGDRQQLAMTLAGVGAANLLRGEREAARGQFAGALGLAIELGAEREGLYAVESTAALVADEGDGLDAVRLLGAARVLRSRLGSPSVPAEEAMREALLRALGTRFGSGRVEALLAEGGRWDGPQTLRAALTALGPRDETAPAWP